MSTVNKARMAALVMSMLAMQGGMDPTGPHKIYESPKPKKKMPLDESELKQLEAFDYWDDQKSARKAKKKFIKQLKEKYG